MKRAYSGVDNATLKLLMSQPWKGNVRELDNVIEHAMILGDGEWITLADLPRALASSDDAAAAGRRRPARRAARLRAHPHRDRAAAARATTSARPPSCSACRSRRSTARWMSSASNSADGLPARSPAARATGSMPRSSAERLPTSTSAPTTARRCATRAPRRGDGRRDRRRVLRAPAALPGARGAAARRA